MKVKGYIYIYIDIGTRFDSVGELAKINQTKLDASATQPHFIIILLPNFNYY